MSLLAAKFLLLCCAAANCLSLVENKSVFGIGTRIMGDQLLMRDILKTPPLSLTEEPFIQFNYAISQPITFIQIISEKGIYASVDFSYENDLVHGTIKKTKLGLHSKPEPFEVLILIYGLNDTVLDVNPAYILNKDQEFNGVLRPTDHQQRESMSLMKEDIANLEHLEDDFEAEDDDEYVYTHHGTNYDDDNDEQYDERTFNDDVNKVIVLGERQDGDYMLYETYQTSPDPTLQPTNHTVTFYYIDNDFISHVQFIIYDHFLDNPLANYKEPMIQFEKISPHTLKAIVTDQHTRNLFVQMQIYGYKPNDKPVAYQSYLTQSQPAVSLDGDVTLQLPLSAHKHTRVFFNAEDTPKHQQHNQQPKGNSNGSSGHLVMLNCLLPTVMIVAIMVIWRQFA